jgi:hypothetical protein
VVTEPRRAGAAYALTDGSGTVVQSGEAEAVIGDDALSVGPVTVSYLDADALRAADYRVELELWPNGRLALSQLGRRFDTFTAELARVRNQARVSGLLAHGITMPEVFTGALLVDSGQHPAELHVFDTHVTIVPRDDDPWQIPLGAICTIGEQANPPGVRIETTRSLTTIGQLGRRREACQASIVERMEAQRQLLADVTGVSGFSDGWGQGRTSTEIAGFDGLFERFAASERKSCGETLLAMATADPRIGFVQLLDPEPAGLPAASTLPSNWATFLLVPVAGVTVLEIVAGPAAATYVFRGEIDAVNADLQMLHFRRAPLALTADQAALTPATPHRLALRRLAPLARLRAMTTARLVHNERWAESLKAAVV